MSDTWESIRIPDPPPPAAPTQELFKWKLKASFIELPPLAGPTTNFLAAHPGFVDVTDTYIRFSDVEAKGFFYDAPYLAEKVAMISSTTFAKLIEAQKTDKWDDFRIPPLAAGSDFGIMTRLEANGKIVILSVQARSGRGAARNPLKVPQWEKLYKDKTKEPLVSSWGEPLRAIDPAHQPPFKLFMVPTGTIYQDALQDAVRRVSAQAAKHKVQIVYELDVANCIAAGMIMYDVDPLGTYQTWIPKDFLADYLSVHEDYPMPSENDVAKILATQGNKLDANAPPDRSWTAAKRKADDADFEARKLARTTSGTVVPTPSAPKQTMTNATSQVLAEYITVAVPTGKKILDASTIAREGSQITVMGKGPNAMATALGWPNIIHPMKSVTGKGPLKLTWAPPNFAQSPAEWLHKSAYKFAGLTEPNVIGNLCIGTSETNSVMIRYQILIKALTEDLWKRLLVDAAAFQDCPTKDQKLAASKATLTITGLNTEWCYESWQLDQTGNPIRLNKGRLFQSVKPPKPATERTWLLYGFSYSLKLNMDTKMIRVPQLLQTRFWPFQRPFYFTVQGLVDRIMLKHIINENLKHNNLPVIGSATRKGPVHEAKRLWSSVKRGNAIKIGGVAVDDADLMYDEEKYPDVDSDRTLEPFTAARILPFDLGLTEAKVSSAGRPGGPIPAGILATLPLPGELNSTALNAAPSVLGNLPDGFVLTGNISLFALFPAKLYSLQGTASYYGVKEIVTLADELSFGTFMPELRGSAIDLIKISNVQLEYCEQHPRHRRAAGTWLRADLTLDGALEPIANALATIFGQKKAKLSVECLLSYGRGWDKLDVPPALTLTCSVPGVDMHFGDMIRFTSLVVDIDVSKRYESQPYSEYYAVEASLSGVALLSVPGSAAPMMVDFSMQPLSDLFSLSLVLRDDDWKDIFGIHGLQLSQVSFFTSFALSATPKLIDFTITAALRTASGDIDVTGSYGNGGKWRLEARIVEVDLNRIINIFAEVLDQGDIVSFDHDIEFSTLWLTIDNEGIFLNGHLSVAGHDVVDAVLQVKRSGISIQGDINKTVEYGGFTLRDAALKVSIPARAKPGTPSSDAYVYLKGTIMFEKISITTAIYLSRLADGSIGFGFFGEYVGLLQLGELIDAAKGTFLDIGLSKIVVVGGTAANIPGVTTPLHYTLKKGVQLCASIANLPALESVTKQKIDGIVLRASYEEGNKLSIGLDLPASTKIQFRPDLATGPISIGLSIQASPCITISSSLALAVQGRVEPLMFTFGMNARLTDASAFCQMDGYWVNPLNISPKLKIGPRMILQLDMSYAPPALSVGIEGSFAFGTKTFQAAVVLGNDPKTELITASVSDLSMHDLTSFAADVTGLSLPDVGENVLNLKQAAFSMSTGVRLGIVDHPAGVILEGSAVIFDKKASLTSRIVASQGLAIAGALDAFTLGPLSVAGKQSPGPQFSIAVSPMEQKFFVDGKVDILQETASIFVDAVLLPSPTFRFDADLHFTDALQLHLHAEMLGQFALERIGDLDFKLTTSLDQHVLEYVSTQLKVQLEAASKGAREGFDKANVELQNVQKLYEDAITVAQNGFDDVNARWTALQNRFNGALKDLEDRYSSRHGELQQAVSDAETKYNGAVTAAENALSSTRISANAAIQSAETQVSTTKSQGETDIRNHERDVERAKDDMRQRFGDASKTLEDKKRDFENEENNMKPIRDEIADLEGRRDRLSRWDVIEKGKLTGQIVVLEAKKLALEGTWKAAQLAMFAAQAVVDGPGYSAAKASVAGYEASLVVAREGSTKALEQAQSSLESIRQTQNASIQDAENRVRDIKSSGADKILWDGAKKTAQDFEDSMSALLASARTNVLALANSAEKAAYESATIGLKAAKDNKAAYEAAKKAVATAQELETVGEGVAKYILEHAGVIVDVNEVKMDGELQAMVTGRKPLLASVKGKLAAKEFEVSVNFSPGQAGVFIHAVFEQLWDGLIKGVFVIL